MLFASVLLTPLLAAKLLIPDKPQALVCVSKSLDEWACSQGEPILARAEVERLFVRTSAEHDLIELGVLNADARRIPATSSNPRLSFTIVKTDNRSADPITITVVEKGTTRQWSLELPPRTAAKAKTLTAAKGRYELQISAPHHSPIRENIDLSSDLRLGKRVLDRYAVISGSVRSADGSPTVGALITSSEGEYATKTDAGGAFAIEVDRDWPESLLASYPGAATKVIGVDHARRDLTLLPVTLTPGARLRFVIPDDLSGINAAELSAQIDPLHRTRVHARSFTSRPSEIVFEDLDRGTYEVTLKGKEPLQRFGIKAEAQAGTSYETTVALRPVLLDIAVTRGGSPVSNSALYIRNVEHGWDARVKTDEAGHFSAEFWQPGQYLLSVKRSEQSAPFVVLKTIDGTETVQLELPVRTIFGAVRDVDAQPIAAVELQVDSSYSDGRTSSLPAATNASGAFELDLSPGVHTITARAEHYLSSEPVTVEVSNTNEAKEVNIVLTMAAERQVHVTNRLGLPFRQAALIQMSGDRMVGTYTTDDQGNAIVQTAKQANDVLYALPKEGSLAVLRLRDESSNRLTEIVVPDGSATLEIRTVDDAGKAIPNVRFLMRIDGEVIPPAVAAYAERTRGLIARTNSEGVALLEHLPVSFFELWPLRTRGEMRDVLQSVSQAAPVQIGLQPGKNKALMTFSRKR